MTADILEESVDVRSEDGVSSSLTIFRCPDKDGRPVIICFPAMGVGARYYHILARQLAAGGVNVAAADLRGVGSSSVRASRKVNYGYFEMIHYDWPVIVDRVKKIFPESPVYLLGHSLGGQVSCLYLASHAHSGISGLIHVAANSVYYKSYGFPGCIKVFLGTQSAFLLSQTLGYFPGHRLGFGGLGAKNLITDWSFQGRTGRYEVLKSDLDYKRLLSRIKLPVISISFEGDNLSPKGSVKHLLKKMKGAEVTHLHLSLDGKSKQNIHFSWARNPEPVVERIADWMERL